MDIYFLDSLEDIGNSELGKSRSISKFLPQNSIRRKGKMGRLFKIFIGSLNLGSIPRNWRKVRVVFIPKAGRSGHCIAKDYSPTSLSSFMLKTM